MRLSQSTVRILRASTMESSSILLILVVLVIGTSTCLAQIHFSPDWGTGKRAVSTVTEKEIPHCWQIADKEIIDIMLLIQRTAKKLSSCLNTCPEL
ncbi:adipokinetic prohormone type 1-like isoform X1 [Aplysia californica]|uniref:Adipokinetic prohormone type 1-like isoform X1 n=2 Tax=Aplysia californica TaxID=6500 RepID=A0ABM1VXK7_APLCA|nr:adipokinetic prohormone type 1-like isoform X1 [Aplysia californica]